MTTEIHPARATYGAVSRPDPEVLERPKRRTFTAEYRMSIVRQADGCTRKGELGALLRREGLYSSHLTNWRHQRAQGALAALAPQRRGRPATPSGERELAQLREENARLARKLVAAETVIEVQKKVAMLLGLTSFDPTEPQAAAGPPTASAGRWA